MRCILKFKCSNLIGVKKVDLKKKSKTIRKRSFITMIQITSMSHLSFLNVKPI